MSGESKQTTDHDEIRRWAEERNATPASVRETGDGELGVLRFDFPGGTGEETLEHVSWDEFFSKFEEKELAMIYQEETSGGETSHFFKFVKR